MFGEKQCFFRKWRSNQIEDKDTGAGSGQVCICGWHKGRFGLSGAARHQGRSLFDDGNFEATRLAEIL